MGRNLFRPGLTDLSYGDLLTEEEFMDAQDTFGIDAFTAGIGAEAIREMLKNIDLEAEAEQLRSDLAEATGELKPKKIIKRLKIVENFLESGNRPEWMITDLSIMLAKGISVPAYTTYAERDYEYIINDCTPAVIFVSNSEQFNKVKNIIKSKLDTKIIKPENNNIKNALVNIGGNIIAIGMRGDRNWIVGIQHPRKPSAIASINLLPGWSIGTSGDYQRYFMMNEKRYSHLINPISGFPSANSQSTTILIPPSKNSGVLSDVYSKPLFIAPTEMKIEIAKKLNIKYFMIIQNDEKILISNEMSKVIKWIDLKDEKGITVY